MSQFSSTSKGNVYGISLQPQKVYGEVAYIIAIGNVWNRNGI
jgi:hypothetical protein